nr:hypothetical protein [uncultured Psychroserpens sp.]
MTTYNIHEELLKKISDSIKNLTIEERVTVSDFIKKKIKEIEKQQEIQISNNKNFLKEISGL